jgi:hypothetical protein
MTWVFDKPALPSTSDDTIRVLEYWGNRRWLSYTRKNRILVSNKNLNPRCKGKAMAQAGVVTAGRAKRDAPPTLDHKTVGARICEARKARRSVTRLDTGMRLPARTTRERWLSCRCRCESPAGRDLALIYVGPTFTTRRSMQRRAPQEPPHRQLVAVFYASPHNAAARGAGLLSSLYPPARPVRYTTT